MTSQAQKYPFAQEFITDAEGQIRKVILDIADYQRLIEAFDETETYLTMAAAKLSEPVFQKIWDNSADANYDNLEILVD